jgi:hypothetical protein
MKVNEIESALLNFTSLKQALRLQNASSLVGLVFPGLPAAKVAGSKKCDTNNSDQTKTPVKSKAAPNLNPHPSLAVMAYANWDKV